VPRTIRPLMTTRVVSVRPDDEVTRAVDLIRRYGFSALPVTDEAYHLVGMISLLDVLRWREEHPDPDDTDQVRVGEIMQRDVLSMRPTAKPTLVAHRLRTYGELRVMPIVERGVLVGVVTRSDLLRPRASLGDRIRSRFRRDDRDEPLLRMARPRRAGPRAPDDAPVTSVMTADVIAVRRSATLSRAVELMLQHRHTALPVAEWDGRLVGLVSEADVLGDPLYTQGPRRTVGDVMTNAPITIDVDTTVGAARDVIAERGLRLLPVVKEGILVGVVGRSDLV
jgi:CBS domain-containing protein